MKRALLMLCLLFIAAMAFSAEKVLVGVGDNSLSLINSTMNETILQYRINSFEKESVKINGEEWFHIRLPKEGIMQDKGMPELPVYNRSIIIDGTAKVSLEVYDIEYQDIYLPVAPSKGVISRDIDPAKVPYTFDKVYMGNNLFPANMAELSEPYIMRDFRGVTVHTTPFAYNPSTKTLRVYTAYKIRVYNDGLDSINTLSKARTSVSKDFAPLYENHFVNWNSYRYTPVNDSYGKLLVICHSNYLTQIAPYINWKRQKGIQTELVEWSTIGTTAAVLKTYIQNRYNADNSITFVQLVGDAPQIPSLSSGGGGSDPQFALVAGSDNYPDIFIGRFSAENTTQVTAQVNKTIAYERDAATTDTWLSRALGIASAEGGSGQGDNGESDIAHMNLIRTDLLNYGYTSVDQVYDPSASASTVTTNVNAGRGFINYVGHGSDTSWVTTGFSSTNATALSNGNKTPFIMDVACVNGNFVSITCFAEAWMRNANGGAVAIYASTINQSWNSPMRAQDEATDLLIAESKTTTGGLYYNASCKMMDVYGNTTGSDGVNMFYTWHIFGDASLKIRTKTPLAMNVTHPATILIGATSLSVSTGVANAMVAITYNNTIYGVATTNSSGNATITLSNPPTGTLNYTITATAFNRVSYIGTVQQIAGSGPYMNVEAATYADNNNNEADFNEAGRFNVTFKNVGTATATNVTATLTCSTPGISLVDASETITSLASNASTTINNAFSFNIANNVVHGTNANFTITMTSGTETWTYQTSLSINAPQFAFGNMTILDPSGNNNGRLDPGETVTISIPLINAGGAASLSGSASLSCSTNGISVIANTANFSSVNAGGSTNLSFSVSAASGMAVGTVASFGFSSTSGVYTANKTETTAVGLIIEDFETGNFNSFQWIQGSTPWTTVNTGAYAGTYAAKSGLISSSGSTTIETTRILPASGTLSFYYKVSSESGYDYLKFYIDGVQQNQWSGEVAWTQASYTLSAGTRVLRWEYMKDTSVDGGSDCAWLDNIIFPSSTAPNPYYAPQNLAASAGNGLVSLSWQAPAYGTPTGYKVFRNSNLLTTVTGLSYVDNNVTNGSSYSYYLKAVYSGGESDPTASVSATPAVISEVIIGSGTAATGNQAASPVNVYYKSLHGQSIYTAAELNSAGMVGAQNITQIGFNITGLPTVAMPNFVVRMKHTTATNVASAWVNVDASNIVYSSASYYPTQTGYNMYTLSTPFAWNGTDNILIDTAFGVFSSSYASTGQVQYTTVTGGYRYGRSDTVDQTNVFTATTTATTRPNVKFVFAPTATGPAISVSPASVSASVYEGESTSASVTISNTGTAALTWNANSSLSSWGSVTPSSGSIAAGANTVVTVNMNSSGLAVGTYNSTIAITSDATTNPNVNVPVSFAVNASPYAAGPRFVAEWENATGVIIAYASGFGLPYSMIADLSTRGKVYVVVTSGSQSTASSALSSNGVSMSNVYFINPAGVNSYWTRDYGPWTIMDSNGDMGIVDFTYNRVRPYDDVLNASLDDYFGFDYYELPLVATGGNVMTDGYGKMMSTRLILTENDGVQNSQVTEFNYTQTQIEDLVQDYLGANEYQFYTDPLANSSIDHIDCFAKLLDVDKVIIARVPSSHTNYAALEAVVSEWQSKTSSLGTPYQIYRVDQTSSNEPYTNSFIYNKKIYVPQWNSTASASDTAALNVYRAAMPGYTVQGYYNSSFLSDDAVHCRINTIFDPQMIHTRHIPPTSAQALAYLSISAEITHANALSPAGTYVAYKHSSSGTWQYATLNNTENSVWSASIPTPALGQTLYYYILATDTTSRTYTTPLCGASDPYEVIVNIPPANQAPSIELPQGFSFDKNSSLEQSFAAYISDPDDDALTLSVSGNSNVLVQITGSTVSFNAVTNWVGVETITFTVSDGLLTDSDTVVVEVTPVNVPAWEPVEYGSTPAVVYAVVTIDEIPAAINDWVAAFVGEECRGTGYITMIDRSTATTNLDVNLAAPGEVVTFKIYCYTEDTVYLVPEVLSMDPGTTYGETEPVVLNGVSEVIMQAPVAAIQSSSTGARIAWNAVPFAGTYKIFACTEPYGEYTLVGTTSSLNWNIDPDQPRMFYRIVAVQSTPRKAIRN